jgi:UDP-N-acetyl-2-amino-2-deoxyglucuronate dehydrogenase
MPLIFASRDLERARVYARRFRGLAAYGSYEAALADPRAAGAVICTPHDRHLADARLAFAAGKHVLVEKPIARTLQEADELIAAGEASGRVVMVAEQFRFMPAFRRLKALLAAGALGELREIHLSARGLFGRSGWRLRADLAGGGALIDGGIHYVHALRWWGGGVRRVFALRPPQTFHALGGEDAVALLAELAGGAVGFLSNSLAAPGLLRLQWSTVTGSEASCFVDNRGRWIVVRGGRRFKLWLTRRDVRGYEAMLSSFADAMASGKVEEMDGAAGRADLAVVLAAYRSIAERRPVDLEC